GAYQTRLLSMTMEPSVDGVAPPGPEFDAAVNQLRHSYAHWKEECTEVRTDNEVFNQLLDTGLRDLRAPYTPSEAGGGVVAAGIRNQGWKDSWDSVVHLDGSLAEPPIALVEVQAYVYFAKLRVAEVFDALGMPQEAGRLRAQAAELRRRFNDVFWMEDEKYFAG